MNSPTKRNSLLVRALNVLMMRNRISSSSHLWGVDIVTPALQGRGTAAVGRAKPARLDSAPLDTAGPSLRLKLPLHVASRTPIFLGSRLRSCCSFPSPGLLSSGVSPCPLVCLHTHPRISFRLRALNTIYGTTPQCAFVAMTPKPNCLSALPHRSDRYPQGWSSKTYPISPAPANKPAPPSSSCLS